MSTRSISDLPTEILYQIDHYLHSCTDRLTCLSVYSRWHHIFKRSLYYWIRIQDATQFQQVYPSLQLYGHLVKILDIQQQLTKEQCLSVARCCKNVQSVHADQQESLNVIVKSLKNTKIHSLSTVQLPMGSGLLERMAEQLTDLTVSVASLPIKLVRMENLQSLAINVHQKSISSRDVEHIHTCFPKLQSLCMHVGDGSDLSQQEQGTTTEEEELQGNVNPCALIVLKFNGIKQNNSVSLLSWIRYICQKYPLLQSLELEDNSASQQSHYVSSFTNDLYQHSASPWCLIANNLTYLSHLSLFGYMLDPSFFTTLLTKNQQKMRVLKLSTPTQQHSNQQQQIPISNILKQYQDTLEELVFWPCQIICSTLDLIHPHLQLCQHLRKLHISGIHIVQEDTVEIPLDTLLEYGMHFRCLKLEYIALSCQSKKAHHYNKLQHIMLGNVTLVNNDVLSYLSKTCPQVSHLSLVSCQFPSSSSSSNMIRINMLTTRFDFLNLYSPLPMTTTHHNRSSKCNYHIQINNKKVQEKEKEKLFINKHKNSNNNNNRIIAIIIQCCSMDQFYLNGNRIQ